MLACALVTALIVPLSPYLTEWGLQYWHGNIEQLFTRFGLCVGRAWSLCVDASIATCVPTSMYHTHEPEEGH